MFRQVAGWIGLAGLLPVLLLYAVSGLVAPLWAVIGLVVVWVVLLVAGIRLRRRQPLRVLLLPILGFAIWFGVVSLGELLLGWTA